MDYVAGCATGPAINRINLGLSQMMDETGEGLPQLTDEERYNPYTRISFRGVELQLWQVAHIYGVNHDMPDVQWRAGASSSNFRALYLRHHDRDIAFTGPLTAAAAIGHVTQRRPLPDSPTLPSSILATREHLYPRTHKKDSHGLGTSGLVRLIDQLVDEAWSDVMDNEETENATVVTGEAPLSAPLLCPPPLYTDASFPPPLYPPPNRPLPSLPQQPWRDGPSGNKHEPDLALPLLSSTSLLFKATEPLKYPQPDRDSESSSQRTITPRASRQQLVAKPAPRVQEISTSAPSQQPVVLPQMQGAPMSTSEQQLDTIRTALQEGPVPAASSQHLVTRSKRFQDAPMPAELGQQPPRTKEVPGRTTSRQQLMTTRAQAATMFPPPRQRLVTMSKELREAPMSVSSVQQLAATSGMRDVSMRKESEQQPVTTPKELRGVSRPAPEQQLLTIRRALQEGPVPVAPVQQPVATPQVRDLLVRKRPEQQLATTRQERGMTPSERQLITISMVLREGPISATPGQLVPKPQARDATMPTTPRQPLVPAPQVGEVRTRTLFGQQPLPCVWDAPMRKASEQQLMDKECHQQFSLPSQARQVTMPAVLMQQPVFTSRSREVSMPTAWAEIERPATTRTVGTAAPAPILRGFGEISMATSRTVIERPLIPQVVGRPAPSILRSRGEDSYRRRIGDNYGRRRQDSGLTETRPRLPPELLQQPLPEFLRNPPSFLQYPPDFSQQPSQNRQPGARTGASLRLNRSKSFSNVLSAGTRPVTPTAEDGTVLTSRWSPDSSPEESKMKKVRKVLSFAKLRPRKSKVFRPETGNELNESTALENRKSASSASGRNSSGKSSK